jgi:hypothetical protein
MAVSRAWRHFLNNWRAERDRLRRIGALADPGLLIADILKDVEAILAAEEEETFSLTRAARVSGYSAGHLGRLVRAGTIPNAGRRHAPRIRRANLPRKATALRPPPGAPHLPPATPGQIARAVVTSPTGVAR